MTRYLATTALTLVAALCVSPAIAQTLDFEGNAIIVDQLAPPGGRCVPQFFNTISFGPGDIVSTGTSNLGTTTETATFCVTSLPPTDIRDGQFTIAFRGGDSISGTFDGRTETTATPGVFAATRNFMITGGTGRFVDASGTITQLGQLSVAMGVATTRSTLDGQITASTATTSGNFATATGAPSAALGDFATAYGAFAIANGERTAAFGSFAEAIASGATAIGDQAIASGISSTALGQLAEATGIASTALGHNADAFGLISTAVGVRAAATGTASVAVGAFAAANATNATAVGANSLAVENGLAVGSLARASVIGATAVGDQTIASGASSTALGQLAEATAPAATALGHNADAFGLASTAVGVRAQATAAGSTALGRLAVASGATATALGANAIASFASSTAVGTGATTTAANQLALGGTGSSVRVGDIAASTAAQSGTLSVATVDANGTLGRNTTLLSSVAALQTGSSAAGVRLDTLDGQVGALFDLRGRDRSDFKKGIAAATAMGQASFPSAPGKTSYVLNGATFRGEAAVGGSLMHRFDTDTPIALGVGFSFAGKKNNAFKAGVAGEF